MWCNEIEIHPFKVAHIFKKKMIDSVTSVLNVIAFLKNMSEEKLPPPTDTVEYCVSVLEKVLPTLDEE